VAETRAVEPARYEFPPADPGGIALGLDGAQLTIIVGSLFGVIASLQAGVPLWLVAPVVAPFLAFGALRLGGERMTTLAMRWAGWWLRPRRSRPGPLTAMARVPGPDGPMVEQAVVAPPAWAKGLELLAVPYRGDAVVGVWRDGTAYVVVLRITAPATALRDFAEQEALTSIWGDLLSSSGVEGSPVERIGWLAHTAPDDGADAAAWLRDHADPTVGLVGSPETEGELDLSPVWRSYREVGDAVGSTAAARDLLAVVRVQPDRARNRLRGVKGREARAAAAAELSVIEAERIGHRLIELGCHAELYKPDALAAIVRTTFDPTARGQLAWWRAATGEADAGVSPASGMWPLSHDEPADHVRTDGGFHRVAWIEEWPTIPVGVTWLHPLLLPSTCNRTVTMVMEPVATYTAARAAHRARASAESDAEVLQRRGFRPTARAERTLAAAEQREHELVDGHRDMRFAGYVCVTATSIDGLEDAWATTVHDAGRARLRLRPLHGEHWPAMAAALPIGRFI
jgi:hypothetical protein